MRRGVPLLPWLTIGSFFANPKKGTVSPAPACPAAGRRVRPRKKRWPIFVLLSASMLRLPRNWRAMKKAALWKLPSHRHAISNRVAPRLAEKLREWHWCCGNFFPSTRFGLTFGSGALIRITKRISATEVSRAKTAGHQPSKGCCCVGESRISHSSSRCAYCNDRRDANPDDSPP